MEKTSAVHNIPPLYDKNSRVLILGSFPSVKSRKAAFFYAHPQNRFWPTLATLFGEETPKTVEEKRSLALRHGVALWDTIGLCEIVGSSDASITNVVPNDLRVILDAAARRMIATPDTAAQRRGARRSSCPPPRPRTRAGRRKSSCTRGVKRSALT